MELRVFWLQFAEDKLQDIYLYYRIKAEKIVNGIANKTVGLAQMPRMGQIENNLTHRKIEYRYLVYANYKIIYWINSASSRVEIANVFDTRQDPQKINEME